MRPSLLGVLLGVLLIACAGPSHNQLAETPTATTRRAPSLAPPASDSDKERYQLDQQFEGARDAQQAGDEANQRTSRPPPKPQATPGSSSQTPDPASKPQPKP